MKLTDVLLADLEREVPRSRRVLEEVPPDKYDWKPHDKSMILGYLANMVATMPAWMEMGITADELDLTPASGSAIQHERLETREQLVHALEGSAAKTRVALQKTTDEFLTTPWTLVAHGHVVQTTPRWVMIQDTVNHWAHHRGQLTVYLRLLGAKVPAIYGPSADDKQFR